MRLFSFLTAAVLCASLAGCAPSPTYQRQEGVPGGRWSSRFQPVFAFDIEDTAAVYELHFLIRHTEAYPFSNLWLNFSIQGPGERKPRTQRLEIPLAGETGQWYGRGMGEIWEQRMPINVGGIKFPKAGRHFVRFEQLMRTDPLPEVLNIGLRVGKIGVPEPTGLLR